MVYLFSLVFLCFPRVLSYILCDLSKFMGLSTLQMVSKLFLGPKRRFFSSFCRNFEGKKRTEEFRSIYENLYA
jgi:hypothetical protein